MPDRATECFFIGVDLGGTSAKIALADQHGMILARDSVCTQADGRPTPVLDSILDAVARLLTSNSVPAGSLAGLGMGIPGLIDVQAGVTKFLPNLPTQWRDVPVASTLGQPLNCPVKLSNDVRTATLGELRYGIGKSQHNPTFAFFSIGTGVGGGVVIDGQVRLGPLGAAGELGHQTMVPNGPRCGCGNHGCLETLASGPAITAEGIRLVQSGLAPNLRRIIGGDMNRVSPETMAEAAEFDPLIAEAIERAAIYLGVGAANVVTILHPQTIVLGGGVSKLGDLLTTVVKREIDRHVGMFPTDDVSVVCSDLGADAGIYGAISLAKEAAGLEV
ncbi:ROK family protein [Rhodopirellula sp. MGV]|uniref:ROK family protein n=1 Tax=Rhodopirellula sp. MGV TaxID=2023130 RepID=UPI000B962F6C|nr:ROK family protein [Rhodopirellula sp. MGV]OYP37005.1 hypothetical protein CGZ80_06525 [Rhodopirellula sp. MGV]PNY36232.1 ROK family protein [Rhodopirellula baltica]